MTIHEKNLLKKYYKHERDFVTSMHKIILNELICR